MAGARRWSKLLAPRTVRWFLLAYGLLWTAALLFPKPEIFIWFLGAEDSLAELNQSGTDKVIHTVGYGLFAILVPLAFGPLTPSRALVLMVLGVGHGLLTEILQPILGPRVFDWYDVLADGVGWTAGLLIGHCLALRWHASTEPTHR